MAEQLELQVRGMTCTGCEARVGKVVGRLDGVRRTEADHRSGQVRVVFDAEQTTPASIGAAIEGAGYEVETSQEGGTP